jgi:alpha-D-xyloside xylohydrolase
MPYLYRYAVEARDTGVPVLRSMALEFPGDPAVSYLDRQYMFGGNLLVAPVFNAEGCVNFYIPDGRWTHLLSGEIREGGHWHTDQYNYFSLPLFMRPGTLFPLGAVDCRLDYDYTNGTEFRLYNPDNLVLSGDGSDACYEAPDLQGRIVLTISVIRKGGELAARFEGPHKNCSLVFPGIPKVAAVSGGSVQAEAGGVRIAIDDNAAVVKVVIG